MGAPEILGKLNPKTCSFDAGIGGGVPTLTWENIAGALGYCSTEAAMTARAILLHDPDSIRKLIGRLMGVTMRWSLDQDQRLVLVTRVVREEIHPDHCWNCGGRGDAMVGAVKAICAPCGGSGRNASHWSKAEAPAADAVSGCISMWISEAMRHVGNELHDLDT